MRRALSLAKRGEGRVEPNPMVGCVIARGESVVGEGYHRRFGGAHAEAAALRAAGAAARGGTAYVTLEPCAHHGKTPPCADALVRAGVARVVIGLADPNPEARGGARVLRKAGVEAVVGVCADEARDLLAPFLSGVLRKQSYVIAKWAQSLDGKLADAAGNSKWISCAAARREVHRLRARVCGVLVGAGTVRADDPMLTARDVSVRRIARRIVLDGSLRTKPQSKIVQTASDVPTLMMTTKAVAASRRAALLEKRGVRVAAVRSDKNGRLVLSDVLRRLFADGVTNLLVEGGPAVLRELFARNLVDEARIYVAPKMLGGDETFGIGAVAMQHGGLEKSARVAGGALGSLPVLEHRKIERDTLYRLRCRPIAAS